MSLTSMKSEPKLYELLRALSADMHQASGRPCQTCKKLTDKLGWPFGCYELQEKTRVYRDGLVEPVDR